MTLLYYIKMMGKTDFRKLKTHYKNILLATIALVLLGSCNPKEDEVQTTTKYAMGIVFRETPYADIQGASMVEKPEVENVKHFEFDYDARGRLIEFRYVLDDELLSFSDRFVRAPKIKIDYQDSLEIRRFYNEYGHRTLVSGDVYEVRITQNDKGERTALVFYGVDGNPIENDFGIAKYHWAKNINGDIIESRYNIKDELVRNRPEFQYMITRFSFDENDRLTEMTNLGLDGKQPTPDDSGTVSTRIKYDDDGRFIEWANFDIDGNPTKGLTNLAKIIYEPSPFFSEQKAIFLDENDHPQNSNWGAHKIIYTFDTYGNEIERTLRDTLNRPTNSRSGLGILKSEYTLDGKHLNANSYYDKEGGPIGFGENQIHGLSVTFDSKNRPVRSSFYDIEGNIAEAWYGYASEETVFDEKGRIIERKYLDKKGNIVNNEANGVAKFEYQYKDEVELLNVKAFNADGKKVRPQWNPDH